MLQRKKPVMSTRKSLDSRKTLYSNRQTRYPEYIEQKEFPVPTISLDYSQAEFAQHPVQSISPPMTPLSLSPKILRRSFSEARRFNRCLLCLRETNLTI